MHASNSAHQISTLSELPPSLAIEDYSSSQFSTQEPKKQDMSRSALNLESTLLQHPSDNKIQIRSKHTAATGSKDAFSDNSLDLFWKQVENRRREQAEMEHLAA